MPRSLAALIASAVSRNGASVVQLDPTTQRGLSAGIALDAVGTASGDALMTDANRKAHWETVYTPKGENEVSWFQENPAPSIELIDLVRSTPDSAIVDIGGGASRLVDSLVAHGFNRVTVLDISKAALEAAKVLSC
jgi:hypothetical protein